MPTNELIYRASFAIPTAIIAWVALVIVFGSLARINPRLGIRKLKLLYWSLAGAASISVTAGRAAIRFTNYFCYALLLIGIVIYIVSLFYKHKPDTRE